MTVMVCGVLTDLKGLLFSGRQVSPLQWTNSADLNTLFTFLMCDMFGVVNMMGPDVP